MPKAKSKKKTLGLEVHGISAPVEFRRHSGARRLTLRVSKTRRAVVVTVPAECRMDEAGRFLKNHIDWVRDRLGRVPEPVPFADGARIPVRGRLHRVRFTGTGRGGAVVSVEAQGRGMPHLNVSGRIEHGARRLRDWLFVQARADLDERVMWHARNLDVRPRRIGLRDQTSRWGSCSSSGLLSFSWRLIMAPPHVLDYVAAHEVAHLIEMNHGARFWKLVAKCVPDLEAAKDWLRTEGTDLHRYGVEHFSGV
ncbi:MAG: M48 family metallopeptidase [Hyphomicrobiaceae bacterium]|nr:MAG: M48 family metallopeptidase [Hyphomicrobiaceae bacterium]